MWFSLFFAQYGSTTDQGAQTLVFNIITSC